MGLITLFAGILTPDVRALTSGGGLNKPYIEESLKEFSVCFGAEATEHVKNMIRLDDKNEDKLRVYSQVGINYQPRESNYFYVNDVQCINTFYSKISQPDGFFRRDFSKINKIEKAPTGWNSLNETNMRNTMLRNKSQDKQDPNHPQDLEMSRREQRFNPTVVSKSLSPFSHPGDKLDKKKAPVTGTPLPSQKKSSIKETSQTNPQEVAKFGLISKNNTEKGEEGLKKTYPGQPKTQDKHNIIETSYIDNAHDSKVEMLFRERRLPEDFGAGNGLNQQSKKNAIKANKDYHGPIGRFHEDPNNFHFPLLNVHPNQEKVDLGFTREGALTNFVTPPPQYNQVNQSLDQSGKDFFPNGRPSVQNSYQDYQASHVRSSYNKQNDYGDNFHSGQNQQYRNRTGKRNTMLLEGQQPGPQTIYNTKHPVPRKLGPKAFVPPIWNLKKFGEERTKKIKEVEQAKTYGYEPPFYPENSPMILQGIVDSTKGSQTTHQINQNNFSSVRQNNLNNSVNQGQGRQSALSTFHQGPAGAPSISPSPYNNTQTQAQITHPKGPSEQPQKDYKDYNNQNNLTNFNNQIPSNAQNDFNNPQYNQYNQYNPSSIHNNNTSLYGGEKGKLAQGDVSKYGGDRRGENGQQSFVGQGNRDYDYGVTGGRGYQPGSYQYGRESEGVLKGGVVGGSSLAAQKKKELEEARKLQSLLEQQKQRKEDSVDPYSGKKRLAQMALREANQKHRQDPLFPSESSYRPLDVYGEEREDPETELLRYMESIRKEALSEKQNTHFPLHEDYTYLRDQPQTGYTPDNDMVKTIPRPVGKPSSIRFISSLPREPASPSSNRMLDKFPQSVPHGPTDDDHLFFRQLRKAQNDEILKAQAKNEKMQTVDAPISRIKKEEALSFDRTHPTASPPPEKVALVEDNREGPLLLHKFKRAEFAQRRF